MRNGEVTFEIEERIGTLKKKTAVDGMDLEVNKVSWNGNKAKIDIRAWNEDHDRMARGITLTEEEAWKLAELLVYRKGYQIVDDDLNII